MRVSNFFVQRYNDPNDKAPFGNNTFFFTEVSLEEAGLKALFHRREELCSILFKQIVGSTGQRKLAGLLPARNENERYNFRNRRMFSIPRVNTKRFINTF